MSGPGHIRIVEAVADLVMAGLPALSTGGVEAPLREAVPPLDRWLGKRPAGAYERLEEVEYRGRCACWPHEWPVDFSAHGRGDARPGEFEAVKAWLDAAMPWRYAYVSRWDGPVDVYGSFRFRDAADLAACRERWAAIEARCAGRG